MQPGPITSLCQPLNFTDQFQVITFDPATGQAIETIYEGGCEVAASRAYISTVKRLERAREEEGSAYEPATVRLWENGEKVEELKIA